MKSFPTTVLIACLAVFAQAVWARASKVLAFAVLVAGFTFNLAQPAHALLWDETIDGGGDAGDTFATAQVVGPGVDQISGVLGDGEKDYFKITIPGGDVTLSNLVAPGITGFSFSQIALFDITETQLNICGTGDSCFDQHANLGTTFLFEGGLTAGMYYIVLDDNFTGETNGAYTFDLSPTTVPIPAALPLFLSGLVAVGLVARRRRSAAAV